MNFKFWKKKDPFDTVNFPDLSDDFSPPTSDNTSLPPLGGDIPQANPLPPAPVVNHNFTPAPEPTTPVDNDEKSQDIKIQLVLSRLDTIKSQLDVVMHRLDKIEQKQNDKTAKGPWYSGR